MQTIEERVRTPVIWVAAVHDDHTDKRHIHALASVQGRLEKPDLQRLREATTQACLEQRRERDLALGAASAGTRTGGVGMGALKSALKQLWVGLSVIASWVHTAFSPTDHLHTSRFARVHELSRLFTPDLEDLKTRLLLGLGPHGQFVGVRGTRTLPELGNCLVVAPTRGGKGLLAVSQLLTWKQSAMRQRYQGRSLPADRRVPEYLRPGLCH